MSMPAVGTWIPKDQVQAYMQKVADNTAKMQAALAASRPATPATAPTPQTSTSKVTSSAAMTAQSVPSSTEITKTYANGSAEAENVGMATGMAHSARINIETLNFGVSVYNSAKRSLENTAQLDEIRKVYGDKGVDAHIVLMKRAMVIGAEQINHGQAMMQSDYSVSGTVVTQDSNGFYKPGQYTQEASGPGWSVSVKSTGEAKAIANGLDVSDQVSNKSSTGFNWADEIAKQQEKLAQNINVAT